LLTVATETPQRTEISFNETNDVSAFLSVKRLMCRHQVHSVHPFLS
jgi:hypothetical protein